MPSPGNEFPPRTTGDAAAKPLPAPPAVRFWLSRPGRILRLASPAAGLFCFALAVWSLQRSSLGAYSYDEIAAALAELPLARIAQSLLLTVAGYSILIGYDLLAFRFIRRGLALESLASASLVSSALSYNLGNSAVTGAALRYWIYGSLGLSADQTTRVALFCSTGFWLGYLSLGALLFSFGSIELPAGLTLPVGTPRLLGLVFFAALAGYLGWAASGKPVRFGPWRFVLPSPALTAGQILVASLDICLMAGVLYALLPTGGDLTYFRFLPLFLVGLIGGAVSQVPGGLGVFETVMAMLLSPWFDPGDLVASLLAFRGLYFILPLFLSLAFLAWRQGPAQLARLRGLALGGGHRLATAVAVGMTTLFALHRMAWPKSPALPRPRESDIERARLLVENSDQTYGNLVLRGDKALVFSDKGDAFLMYGRMGRSWIAMGDPIGSETGIREVARRFRDLSEGAGGWCVFFEVQADRRDLYADLGLVLTQLGEEARVYLPDFSLEGHESRQLRRSRANGLRQGCHFEILPREAVPAALPALQRISDAWLARKPTCEKGFSNAPFDGRYLAHFPVAAVHQEGRIIAFANLWLGAGKEELSIDLMRHLPEAPHGTMDFLFSELLCWGRAQGFRWFNFGMAPLSGLGTEPGSPRWNRIGSFLYRHGRRYYNFHGLRHYKEKFHPVWTPLYLASPGGLALGPVLVDVTALMAGGMRGIIGKYRQPARGRR